jgi:hypothetical protein
VFLAVTALSLVITSTRTAGRPDEDDENSEFLEYPHDPVTDAKPKNKKKPLATSVPDGQKPAPEATNYPTHRQVPLPSPVKPAVVVALGAVALSAAPSDAAGHHRG